jgi:hypothetical protein
VVVEPREWNVGSNLMDAGRSAVHRRWHCCRRRFGEVQDWPN